MGTDERLRTQLDQLAEDFPGWACAPGEAGVDGRVVITCRRAMPSRPIDVAEDAAAEGLDFTGDDWDDAIQAAERGLRPGDQGEPDGLL